MVRLRLSCQNPLVTIEELNGLFSNLTEIVKDYLVIDEDLSLQETISRTLIQQNKTLAIAESCTGGYISHLITAIPGSSMFFKGSIISYSNEAKIDTLDVPAEILAQFGAVSLETVERMAEGVRLKMKTDFALATSGIMGPGGGTDTKPVGFVCIAFSSASKTESTTLQFRFDRQRNIELTAAHSLNFLRKNMG
jgi:nicotinamide-nucleotide amidase